MLDRGPEALDGLGVNVALPYRTGPPQFSPRLRVTGFSARVCLPWAYLRVTRARG